MTRPARSAIKGPPMPRPDTEAAGHPQMRQLPVSPPLQVAVVAPLVSVTDSTSEGGAVMLLLNVTVYAAGRISPRAFSVAFGCARCRGAGEFDRERCHAHGCREGQTELALHENRQSFP